MGDLTAEQRAAYRALWDRHTLARTGPYGTWAQRWLPRVCKHPDVRCVHGDEIIARGFRRVACRVCGRSLRRDLPRLCWFTGTPHPSAPEETR